VVILDLSRVTAARAQYLDDPVEISRAPNMAFGAALGEGV
jgi:hypothetical protein